MYPSEVFLGQLDSSIILDKNFSAVPDVRAASTHPEPQHLILEEIE